MRQQLYKVEIIYKLGISLSDFFQNKKKENNYAIIFTLKFKKTTFMKIIIAIFLLFLLSACSKVDDETLRAAHKAYSKGAIIVDVRTAKEFKSKHIKGAINLPVQELHNTYVRLPKGKEIIVYCRSGNRSSTATKLLISEGFTVFDVATQSDWERDVSVKK
jgi:phage shock protein E